MKITTMVGFRDARTTQITKYNKSKAVNLSQNISFTGNKNQNIRT